MISARFNLNNTQGFCGFNLKSAAGSGASGFGAGELVSFGTSPSAGNQAFLVTDASGQRTLDMGAPVTNTIIDFQLDFDALNRRYVVGAKFRTNSVFNKISGTMSGTGTSVTHIGFANWNTGSGQDLLFDSLQLRGSSPLGGGTNSISVSTNLSSLSSNTLYNYRVTGMNLDGGVSNGVNTTFFTGTDLAMTSSVTGGPWIRGAAGQIILTISNAGSAASTTSLLTVTATLPVGLTSTGMAGTGWTSNSNGLSCTRSNALAVGSNHPVITLNVAVASNAPANLQPTFTLSGGGDGYSTNNTNTISVTTISPVDSWRNQYFGSADNSGPGADTNAPAGDGVSNLMKYALGMDPTVPTTHGLPEMKMTNGRLALTFSRQKSAIDIVYQVQAAGDLFGFSNATVVWSSASNAYGGGTNSSQAVTVQDAVDAASTNRRFMRLQISRP